MSVSDIKQIKDFLSKYDIVQINPQTMLLNSKNNNLLVKKHPFEEENYDNISQILDLHLSFDPQYICPLLDFEQEKSNEKDFYMRTIYQIDRVTLKD